MTVSTSPPLLGPGEVLKPSGKFNKPTKIPGKKYCKDEVVIRNGDSGKGTVICIKRYFFYDRKMNSTVLSNCRTNYLLII